jgi:tetratricopeptide (TPR) repeat protein
MDEKAATTESTRPVTAPEQFPTTDSAQTYAGSVPRLAKAPWLILTLLAIGVGLFAITYNATTAYRNCELQLADSWYHRGETDLANGRAEDAVTDFRTALNYDREQPSYRLRLAEALLAARHDNQAYAYFESLYDNEPGDGYINLQLARIAARRHNVADAMRFYNGAIYGVWPDSAPEHRRGTRIEFINFLLEQGDTTDAHSQLISLTADLPPRDAALLTTVADQFRRVQDWPRADDFYRRVLRLEPANAHAAAGLGECELMMGRFHVARAQLQRAVSLDPTAVDASRLLPVATAAERVDPYDRGLNAGERARRASAAFQQAGRRLQQCGVTTRVATPPPIPPAASSSTPAAPASTPKNAVLNSYALQWVQLQPRVSGRDLGGNPDAIDQVMQLVFDIETAARQQCPAGTTDDDALLAIANVQAREAQ